MPGLPVSDSQKAAPKCHAYTIWKHYIPGSTNSSKPRVYSEALASSSSLVNHQISLSQQATQEVITDVTLPVKYSKGGTFSQ